MIKYKKRIWPMLCGIILLIFLVLGVCVTYVTSMLVVGVSQDLERFDDQVGKFGALIKQEDEHFFHLLNIYGNYVNEHDEGTLFSCLNALKEVALESSFDQVGILNKEGKGYLINGTELQLTTEQIKEPFVASLRQLVINEALPQEMLIYGMPYFKDHECKGMVIGLVSLKTALNVLDTDSLEALQALYLLNEDQEVIVDYCRGGEKLDYHLATADDIYDKAKWESVSSDIEHQLVKLMISNSLEDKNSLFTRIISEGGTIWYKQEITDLGGKDFTLMVARKVSLSNGLKNILNETAKASSVLCIIFLIFFFIMIVTNRMEQRQLGALAYIDPVTEGENWNKLKVDVKKRLRRRRNRNYALVTFDIDHFKLVNDIYGHNKGNEILYKVYKIVKKQLQKKEWLVRYSGDVFSALVYAEDETALREKICKWQTALFAGLDIEQLHFSFGIYKITDYTLSIDRMSIYASLARETVKQERENKIAFFDEEMRSKLLKEQMIENQMEDALANKEFKVYLQPKYPPDGGHMGGAEALVRWISPTNGFVSPGEFIPIFEKNSFIIQLDEYMLEEVCKLQRGWLDEGKMLVPISVNISRIHLLDEGLIPMILQKVDHYRLPHDCIELELTESAFFDDKQKLIHTVEKLKENGFAVSMDDFGSGYSSLNTLKDLPFDVVKLDGEFFRKMADQTRSRIIIEDTIALAKHLNLQIVAEGIEEKEQVDFLQSMGCDLIQGFYFAKPMPVEEFSALL